MPEERSLDMIHIVGKDGRIIDANQAELETMGYTKEEYVGKPLMELIAPEFRESTQRNVSRVLAGEDVQPFETALIASSGERVSVEVNAVPLMDAGQIVAVRGILRNITDR